MSEKKVVGRNVAFALGMICVFLVIAVVGAVAVYASIVHDKDNTIASKDSQLASMNSQLTSLDSQISSLNTLVTSLQNQVNNLTHTLNATAASVDKTTLNPSAMVNETVIVEGKLRGPLFFIPEGMPPWNYELDYNGTNIGVLWNVGNVYDSANVRVYGVVTEGRLAYDGWMSPPVVYFIQAERIDALY